MKRNHNKRGTKRGQMEILGLAIVVVLLLLAFAFVLRFLILQKPDTFRKTVVESQQASNYIATYLKVNVPACNYQSTRELLQNCAVGGTRECPLGANGQPSQDGSTINSCEASRLIAERIFAQTFDVWKTPYHFKVTDKDGNPIGTSSRSFEPIGDECPGARSSKTFPQPSGAGTIYITLDLCQ